MKSTPRCHCDSVLLLKEVRIFERDYSCEARTFLMQLETYQDK